MSEDIDIVRAGLASAPSSSTNTAACGALVRLSETVSALETEVAAWRALALGIADKGGAIDCLRAEPDGCVFMFVGEHQSTNAPPGEAAVDLARQLKLIPEEK